MIRNVEVSWLYVLGFFVCSSSLIFLIFFSSSYILPFSGDYKNYIDQYYGYGTGRFEPGYKLLINVLGYINEQKEEADFVLFWSFISYLTILTKCFLSFSFRKSTVISFFLCYVVYAFLLHEANQFRAAIGLTFALVSFYFASKRSGGLSLFFLFLSFNFHFSMMLFLPPLFFIYRGFDLHKCIWVILLIGLIAFFVFDPGILGGVNPLMQVYSTSSLDYKFNTYYLIVLTSLLLLGYFSVRDLEDSPSKYLWVTFFFFFVFALSIKSIPIVSVRVMDISTIIALFFVHSLSFKENNYNRFLYFFVYVLCFARFYMFMTTDTIYRFN